jgi:hypothetical protein
MNHQAIKANDEANSTNPFKEITSRRNNFRIEATAEDVIGRAKTLLQEKAGTPVPGGEFWRWAYAPPTLQQVCALRAGLQGLCSHTAAVLRAVCLGASW